MSETYFELEATFDSNEKAQSAFQIMYETYENSERKDLWNYLKSVEKLPKKMTDLDSLWYVEKVGQNEKQLSKHLKNLVQKAALIINH